MMQCADPNTLPAPSRLHQLGQSLSLSLLSLRLFHKTFSPLFIPASDRKTAESCVLSLIVPLFALLLSLAALQGLLDAITRRRGFNVFFLSGLIFSPASQYPL